MINKATTSIKKRRIPLFGLIYFFAILTVIVTLLTLFSDFHRLVELFSHFKLQYLISSIVFCGLLAYTRHFRVAMLLGACVLVNGYFIVPWYYSNIQDVKEGPTEKLKIVHLNLLSSNRQYQKVIDLVQAEKPDILIAQEVSYQWKKTLTELTKLYPYNYIVPRTDNFGIALLSIIPLESVEEKNWGNNFLPGLIVSRKLRG